MADNDITLGITYDIKDAVSALNSLETETKKSSSSITKAFETVKTAAVAAVAVVAAREVIDFFKEAIGEAAAADQAIQGLNFALAASGEYSSTASKSIQAYASAIQDTTTFTDDAVISSVTLAKNFGLTNDQAKDLVKTATNLAAVQGTDLNTATERLLASLNGQGRALKELGPSFAGLTEDQLKSGEALRLLDERFGNAATTLSGTFSGSLQQAKNQFGEIYESFGKSITQNENFAVALHAVSEMFKLVAETFQKNQGAISGVFTAILKGAAEIADIAVNGFAIVATGFLELGKAAGQAGSLVEAAYKAMTGDFKGAKFALDDFKTSGNSVVRTLDGFEQALDKAAKLTRQTADAIGNVNGKAKESDDAFKKASDSAKAYGEALGKSREEALKFYKELSLASADTITKAELQRDEDLKKINKYEKERSLTYEEAETARFEASKKASIIINNQREKDTKQALDNLKKFQDDAKKLVEEAGNNGLAFIINHVRLGDDALSDLNNQISLSLGVIKNVLGGKEGAKELVSTAAGAIGDAVIPGIGPYVKEIFKVLALGPDAVKELVRDFVNELPNIITNIADAAPAFVEAFVDSMVTKGGAVKIGIAIAYAMSGAPILKALGAQIGNEFANKAREAILGAAANISSAISSGLGGIGDSIRSALGDGAGLMRGAISGGANELNNTIRTAIGESANYMKQQALDGIGDGARYAYERMASGVGDGARYAYERMSNAIIDGVNQVVDKLKSAVTPGGGGGNGVVSDTYHSVLGHADGGIIPRGFPNDSYRAGLTSNERVLSVKQNEQFEGLLTQIASGKFNTGGGGNGPMTVILQVGEQQLAKAILNLNRQGFRTA